ncbi:MAG: 4-hydroxy-tetrahydrodipicolinate reductase, partial [Chitinophagaceae bacterium]
MNIALVGYGKMGKAIEEIALERGHKIVLRINDENLEEFTEGNITKAHVAIEFTGPHSAFENIKKIIGYGVPVVCGSTGWTDRINEINDFCKKQNGSFLYASNFSVGVNIFFELNKKLAALMATHPEYNTSMEEIH